jgi:exodeoxyribonuclease V alpha subunit
VTDPITLLRVKRVYSQNPLGFGGAIFACSPIDPSGQVLDAGGLFVVHARAGVLAGTNVQAGQWWEVRGPVQKTPVEINGFRMVEHRLVAQQATLQRPSGDHIITLMAESDAFEGIGYVKARRLWEAFGEQLYKILDEGDLEALSSQLTPAASRKAISAWGTYGDAHTLQWLQAQGFDVALGRKIVAFFGTDTAAKIEEDPYRLLSFCATWNQVDDLARRRFKVDLFDPRRLQGAIEEACYRRFSEGHTLMQQADLMPTLTKLLASDTKDAKHGGQLAAEALKAGWSNGSYVIDAHGLQPLGAKVMESVVARSLHDRMATNAPAQLLTPASIDELIANHEASEGIALNTEQCAAIHLACAHEFACISGGAGVGKTTLLKALYKAYDAAGVCIVQMAVAGRAAKQMHEATGRSASTIATFLRTHDLTQPTVLVIDEASMLDIISMSRICELLSPEVRLLLVGDPHQLMPVGPGLVLHTVVKVPKVPVVELKVVKRYGDVIREAAAHIRDGRWPQISADLSGEIAFLPCPPDEASLAEAVFELYERDPQGTQILSSHRRGPGGTHSINALCQSRLSSHLPPVLAWNEVRQRHEATGLHEGDVVLCTRNFWDRDLQNGSLGRVVGLPSSRPAEEDLDPQVDPPLGWIKWDDDRERPIKLDMLDDLELGYAITVHKAQGSQWPRVVIPVTRNRMLDRTLLYTALTRGQQQVVLVGDVAAARAAVERPPHSMMRKTGLGLALTERLRMAAQG